MCKVNHTWTQSELTAFGEMLLTCSESIRSFVKNVVWWKKLSFFFWKYLLQCLYKKKKKGLSDICLLMDLVDCSGTSGSRVFVFVQSDTWLQDPSCPGSKDKGNPIMEVGAAKTAVAKSALMATHLGTVKVPLGAF